MKVWLVNTNSKEGNGNPNAYKYMLRQNKAAAFYWRASAIDKIEKGDLILLYHNQNRIIAVGAVVDPFSGHDFGDIEKVEHWVDVNWLWQSPFNESIEPTDYIDRNRLEITMVNNSVVNVTNQVNHKKLLEEIARKQRLF